VEGNACGAIFILLKKSRDFFAVSCSQWRAVRYLRPAIEAVLHEERKMAFVAGPRQVGKTTLARSLLGEGSPGYFNWDVESHRRRVLRDPDGFWTEPGRGDRTRIVLDEIHKYPRWKRMLKGLYDAHAEALEIIVTGSGRLDVYQKGGDSLLGRYALHRLHPFTVGELLASGRQQVIEPGDLLERLRDPTPIAGAGEALDHVERFTGFPEPLFAARMERLRRWRRSRRQLVLREDLRDLSRIRDLGLVDQLVVLLPGRVGSPLSVNALAEDVGVAFGTARSWIETLGRLYYLFEVRPYAGKLARTLRREAKIYLYDHTEIEDAGARFENVVALHLLKAVDAWNDLGQGDFALHYVRDKERREVDFLVTESRRPFLLVEAKISSALPSPALAYFQSRLRVPHALQIVREGVVRRGTGIPIIPADRVLVAL